MKKLLSGILTAALVLSCCTIPAFAASKTIYLDGYNSTNYNSETVVYGTAEVTDPARSQLKLTGDLTQTDTFVDSKDGNYTCPVYTASGSVTVTTTTGFDSTAENSYNIVVLDIESIKYDAASKLYTVLDPNAVYFDGTVVYYDQNSTEKTCTCREYNNDTDGSKYMLGSIKQGATATISAPGTYYVTACAEALGGACSAIVIVKADTVGGFSDVTKSAYYADPVIWAVGKSITNGTTPTTFSPDVTCTQAQILTFLYRACGSPAVTGTSAYTNAAVTSNQYYYNALLWAYEKGIATDAALDPNAACSRSDVALYLWRNAGSPAASASAFSDVSASAAYSQAVAWAVSKKVTTGTSATTFSPNETCTRGQIVAFLYRDLA